MMKRFMAIALILTLLFGVASANNHGDLDVGPGLIGSDSPLYGLEVAWDNAAVDIGLKKAGGVAQERAAEAKAAADKGNHDAAARAANEMSKVAQKARSDDTERLQKAETVLQEVMANAPAEAQEGLQTALDSVRNARERAQQADDQMPTDTPTGGDQAPDSQGEQQDRDNDSETTSAGGPDDTPAP